MADHPPPVEQVDRVFVHQDPLFEVCRRVRKKGMDAKGCDDGQETANRGKSKKVGIRFHCYSCFRLLKDSPLWARLPRFTHAFDGIFCDSIGYECRFVACFLYIVQKVLDKSIQCDYICYQNSITTKSN
jgi:hypothetical protein